jgi:CheY-like chemotaxis protein
MPLLLVLEDTKADLLRATDLALRAGFTQVRMTSFATDARRYLESAMAGEEPLPDAMLIDLDLGLESGFEILRMWHSNLLLRRIPVIVWTVMCGREREICRLFGVDCFISKTDDPRLLRQAFAHIVPHTGAVSERSA